MSLRWFLENPIDVSNWTIIHYALIQVQLFEEIFNFLIVISYDILIDDNNNIASVHYITNSERENSIN